MSVSDIKRRVLVSYEGDESDLKKALDTIQLETRNATDEFKTFAVSADKATDGAATGFSKFSDSLKRVGGGLTSAVGGLNDFIGKMGPWNQVLELGGKAVDFASKGLDAYGKTSATAAAEVEKLKTEFGELRDGMMEWAGAATVALLKPLPYVDEWVKKIETMEDKIRGLKALDLTPTLKMLGEIEAAYNRNQQAKAEFYGGFGDSFEGAKEAQAKSAAARASAKPRQRDVSEFIGGVTMDSAPATAPRAPSLGSAAAYQDDTSPLIRQAETERMMSLTDEWHSKISERQRARQPFLESMFGPIDEFNAYATAFGAVNTAAQSAMSAWISGSMSAGTAIKKGIGDALGGVAADLMGQGIRHGAYAVGSAAMLDFAGASRHAGAAAFYASSSIGVAAIAKKLGGGAPAGQSQSPANAKGSSGSGAGAIGGGGGSGASGFTESPKTQVTIVYGDSFAYDSPRNQQVRAERLVRMATGSAAVVHS